MHIDPPVASDYASARARFREAARRASCDLASHPIGLSGPSGEELTIDVARRGSANASRVVVVSSGTHGVEGFFGSGVQVAYLRRLAQRTPPKDVALVFVHAVNPYGFAWTRRVNEDNIDLNRNFVRDQDEFRGGAELYGSLDTLLNPKSAPRRLERFWGRAALKVGRHGFRQVKNAIASGQYDFPRGLFFGGRHASRSRLILERELPGWIEGAERVIHVDLHTGMGRWGTYTLAVPFDQRSERVARLEREFGVDNVSAFAPDSVLYEIRGNLGQWCQDIAGRTHYDTLLAEFGTYNPLHVLAALRKENRAHHYCDDPAIVRAAKRALKETFFPESRSWQRSTNATATHIVDRAVDAARGGR